MILSFHYQWPITKYNNSQEDHHSKLWLLSNKEYLNQIMYSPGATFNTFVVTCIYWMWYDVWCVLVAGQFSLREREWGEIHQNSSERKLFWRERIVWGLIWRSIARIIIIRARDVTRGPGYCHHQLMTKTSVGGGHWIAETGVTIWCKVATETITTAPPTALMLLQIYTTSVLKHELSLTHIRIVLPGM